VLEATGGFSLDQLRYEYPYKVLEPARSPQETLADRVAAAQVTRCPGGTLLDTAQQIAGRFEIKRGVISYDSIRA
jgi:error-prone DNA polymerase